MAVAAGGPGRPLTRIVATPPRRRTTRLCRRLNAVAATSGTNAAVATYSTATMAAVSRRRSS